MPAKPSWFPAVPAILERLQELDVPFVDRASLQNVFGIGRRRAHALMASFGGYQVGKTFLIDRTQLISALESLAAGQDFQIEHRRKERLSAELDKVRQFVRASRVTIPATPLVYDTRLSSLPSGVHLEPGRLTVEFDSPAQLLERLFALSQALVNDLEGLQAAMRPL